MASAVAQRARRERRRIAWEVDCGRMEGECEVGEVELSLENLRQ